MPVRWKEDAVFALANPGYAPSSGMPLPAIRPFTEIVKMKPISRDDAMSRLVSLRFEATPCDGDQVVARGSSPPIVVEDNAFMSWWKPDWLERFRIMCGAPVRVLVNYSL